MYAVPVILLVYQVARHSCLPASGRGDAALAAAVVSPQGAASNEKAAAGHLTNWSPVQIKLERGQIQQLGKGR